MGCHFYILLSLDEKSPYPFDPRMSLGPSCYWDCYWQITWKDCSISLCFGQCEAWGSYCRIPLWVGWWFGSVCLCIGCIPKGFFLLWKHIWHSDSKWSPEAGLGSKVSGLLFCQCILLSIFRALLKIAIKISHSLTSIPFPGDPPRLTISLGFVLYWSTKQIAIKKRAS